MSELAECREAMREPPVSDWFKALRGEPTPAVEETPSLDELFTRPGKATRDWYEVIGVAGSMELWPPGWAEDRLADQIKARLDLIEANAPAIMDLAATMEIGDCPYCGSGVFEDGDGESRCAGCMEIVSLDVELVAPGIVDFSDDEIIMGILTGAIPTLCLDCSERDCPAHPVNGIA